MGSVAKVSTIHLIRQLLSEIRKSTLQKKIKDLHITRYVMSECRRHQTTDKQLCKAGEEMKYLATTYVCYLKSKRKCQEINAEYKGKGERSVESTAKLVGFKLPHDDK